MYVAKLARPEVSRTAVDEAIAAVEARCHAADHPHLESFSDEPAEFAAWMAHRGAAGKDVLAGLLALTWARHRMPLNEQGHVNDVEYRLLQLGQRLGVSLAAMARPLGVRGRAAVHNRIRRHEAQLAGGPRNEGALKRLREEARRPVRVTAEDRWFGAYGAVLYQLAGRLPVLAKQVSEDVAEDLYWLRDDLAAVTDPADTGQMHAVAAAVRLVLPDLADEMAPAVLSRLRVLIEQHETTLPA